MENTAVLAASTSSSMPRKMSGVVESNAMQKTIVVRVERQVAHPKYRKLIKRSMKLHAHDENSDAKVGDVVTVVECRPYSKTKTWRLEKVDARAI